jgi:hypothetical protein
MPNTSWRFAYAAVVLGIAVLQLSVATPARAQGPNPVLNDLLQQGVPLPGNKFQKLRPPSLPDGLTDPQQQQAVNAVLAKKLGAPVTFEQFTKKGLNAPLVLLIDDPEFYGAAAPVRTDHTVDLWFCVYGKLATVTDPAFMKAQFNISGSDQIDTLKPEALQARKLVPQKFPGGGEYWVHGQFKIFPSDLVVQLQATAHAVTTSTDASGTLAAMIDQRFNQDKDFPNEWRPVLRNPNGGIQTLPNGNPALGAPQLYVSCGAYIKSTPLVGVPGALFIEYHLVYDEPQAWFNGKNLLRSKLPQKALDDVRDFRRKVKKAEGG